MDEQDAEPTTTSTSAPIPRPYFIPATITFEALPEAVRLAMQEIIEPTYRELVLGAATALERSAGVTLTFLLSLEVLDQFELGGTMDFAATSDKDVAADREKLIARHLRLVAAKQQTTNFLMRLKIVRATKFSDPFRKSPI